MKIALDGTPLTLSSGGLRRYVAELSTALTSTFSQEEFLRNSSAGLRGGDWSRPG